VSAAHRLPKCIILPALYNKATLALDLLDSIRLDTASAVRLTHAKLPTFSSRRGKFAGSCRMRLAAVFTVKNVVNTASSWTSTSSSDDAFVT